jgi:RimJ/RimL family protein N-acetyltransferase
VEVPRLQTERLLLREWGEDDLDAYAETYADPEVMRSLGGPVAREQVWRHIALLVGHWQLRVDPANAASERVARRLGMTPDGPSELLGKPVVIWRR